MKTTATFLLLTFVFAGVIGQDAEPASEAAAAENADDAVLQVAEKEVEEAIVDIKADEGAVAAAQDEKTVAADEVLVNHEEAVMGVEMDDIDEMMLDIKDDEMDNDADIIERKLDDIKDAKEHNRKSAAEHRKHELEKKKKRNAARRAKHADRARKHAERHKKTDAWITEMKHNHPNKAKRAALLSLYNLLAAQHAALHAKSTE